jgi:hypothetical protein
VPFGKVLAILAALDIRISHRIWWQGGDLDRLVHAQHSRLHESVAGWFDGALPEWVLAPEVSFSIYGERGIIDILAWHPGRRALVVIELKTDIVEVNELIGTVDQKRRLAREIALERGWDPLTISTWVIVARSRTNEARLAAHRSMLRNAFPSDGVAMQRWLHVPDSRIDALSLWARGDGKPGELAARHRVSARS